MMAKTPKQISWKINPSFKSYFTIAADNSNSITEDFLKPRNQESERDTGSY